MSLVSVVIPCHDLGAPLEDAVDSVFAQTFSEVEILVVDDGSTEPATRRLLADYDWPRTRVLARPDHEPARALQAGLDAANGAYVAVLDPRGSLAPTYLAKAVAALEADAGLGLVTSWLEVRGEPGEPVPMTGLALPDLLVADTVGPAAVARRCVLVDAGGFDPAFASGADAQWDLWIRLAARATRSAVLEEPLVRIAADALGGLPPAPGDGEDSAALLALRHRDLHARHLPAVLAGKEAVVRAALRRQHALAHRLDVVLEQERARQESERRRAALARAEAPPPAPPADQGAASETAAALLALAAARAEIEDLRRSASWRLTGPLRTLHRWARRARGRD